jgi:hypothetical protein
VIVTRPYLVQRGNISKLAPEETRLTKAVDLDYMGSAEFEFGALPKSLRALQSGTRTLRIVSDIKQDDVPLRVLSAFNEEEFGEYIPYLHELRADKICLKEWLRFSPDRIKDEYAENFWWDIENHVMWSFHKQFMNRLENYLQASFAYMDSNK